MFRLTHVVKTEAAARSKWKLLTLLTESDSNVKTYNCPPFNDNASLPSAIGATHAPSKVIHTPSCIPEEMDLDKAFDRVATVLKLICWYYCIGKHVFSNYFTTRDCSFNGKVKQTMISKQSYIIKKEYHKAILLDQSCSLFIIIIYILFELRHGSVGT